MNKLFLHSEKVQSILGVIEQKDDCDYTYPLSVDVHLTNRCNLKCEWCTDRDINLGREQMDRAIALMLIQELAQMGCGITLEGGGEPTVYPYFEEVIRAGNDFHASMGLITNGVKNISAFINSFKWVRISLDASCKGEYLTEKGVDCFESVLENIKSYKEVRNSKSTFLGVGYVLTKRNYSCIEELISFLNECDVDYIYMRPVEGCYHLCPCLEELKILEMKLLKLTENMRIKVKVVKEERYEINNGHLPCVAHSLTSIVHANGDVACCEKRKHDPQILGNINCASYKEIWNSDKRLRITQQLLQPISQKGCDVCRLTAYNHLFTDICGLNTINFI
mgnify:CR=1 FL=1